MTESTRTASELSEQNAELLAVLQAIVTTWEHGDKFTNEIGAARDVIAKVTGQQEA